MQRAAGTFRMVPDPQTSKGESGTDKSCGQHYLHFPLWKPLELLFAGGMLLFFSGDLPQKRFSCILIVK